MSRSTEHETTTRRSAAGYSTSGATSQGLAVVQRTRERSGSGSGTAALGNNERCLTPLSSPYSTRDTKTDGKARRAARERDQAMLARGVLQNTNISGCAKGSIRDQEGNRRPIEVRHNGDAGAYLSGVQFCGSVWFCPRCSPVILYRRGQEIDRICRLLFEHGGSVYLLTLTVRHWSTDPADRLVNFVVPAMSNLLKGSKWTKLARRLGYVGLSRVVEVTWSGRSGFHPHVHAALCFDRKLTDAEYGELLRKFREWWVKLVADTDKGLNRSIVPSRAVDLREWEESVDAVYNGDGEELSGNGEGHGPARYMTKIGHGWGIGSELAGGNAKQAKGRSMNPAQLVSTWVASDLAGEPDQRLVAVIRELHAATFKRHMTHVSAPLRKWAAERTDDVDDTEVNDEDIVHEDVGGDVVAEIDPEVYGWIDRLVARSDILEGAEQDGIDGCIAALKDRGLPVIVEHRTTSPDCTGSPPLIKFGRAWRCQNHRLPPPTKFPKRKATT